MSPREDGLRGFALSLERLEDGPDLISEFGILVDLALEALEDPGIYHSSRARHDVGGGGFLDSLDRALWTHTSRFLGRQTAATNGRTRRTYIR
jgi:hypothetical protein